MKPLLLLLVFPAVFFSCKKEKHDPTPSFNATEYFPGKTGSYWVYEHVFGDTLGNFVSVGFDSTYIVADTMINDVHLKTYKGWPLYSSSLTLKDSGNIITNQSGALYIVYTANDSVLSTDIDSTNGQLILKTEIRMMKDIVISTPAGTFTTAQLRTILTPLNSPGSSHFYRAIGFSKNVGLVYLRTFYSNHMSEIHEWRLVRYSLVN